MEAANDLKQDGQRPDAPRQDLLYCRTCGRHWRGRRRTCPDDGSELRLVESFHGLPGDEIDSRYEIINQIGVGGMGTVLRAWDRIANQEVALKVLNADHASHAASATRFLREARLLSDIQHPGVVGVNRYGRTLDGMLLIDMELVDGESVREYILRTNNPLDVVTGLKILENLLDALAACHAAGVVHCDVKPENIMLRSGSAPGACKLVDFGIAQAPGDLADDGGDCGVIGTPAYMSPEQVRGVRVDPRTDLYLLGCVAYELLSGDPPFEGKTPLELCHHQLLSEPPRLSERLPGKKLPDGFELWVSRLLAKDPEMRPSSARAARDELHRLRLAWRRKMPAVFGGEAFAGNLGLRPPSSARLRRRSANGPVIDRLASQTPKRHMPCLRALVEIRQSCTTGVTYGPRAVEEIGNHVLAAELAQLRDLGAVIIGPAGPHLEIRFDTSGDERGAVHHLLDSLAAMNGELGRIPEPRLEIRAAVVAWQHPGAEIVGEHPGLDLLTLLQVGPGCHVRVDEHVARWAGRRSLVRLATVRDPSGEDALQIYATSLQSS